MAAWNLTRKDVKILLLDAGTRVNRADFWTHTSPGKHESATAAANGSARRERLGRG